MQLFCFERFYFPESKTSSAPKGRQSRRILRVSSSCRIEVLGGSEDNLVSIPVQHCQPHRPDGRPFSVTLSALLAAGDAARLSNTLHAFLIPYCGLRIADHPNPPTFLPHMSASCDDTID